MKRLLFSGLFLMFSVGAMGQNVGIGNATPTAKLHVTDASTTHAFQADESGDGEGSRIIENGNGHGLHVISQSVAATDRQVLIESNVSTLGGFLQVASNGQGHFMEMFSGRDGDPQPYIMVNSGEPIRFATNAAGFCENAIIQPNGDLRLRGSLFTSQVLICSDKRLKKNFQPIENSLEKLCRLNGVYFDWQQEKFKAGWASEDRQIGFIAQEVQVEFPEAVTEKEDGYLTVDYQKMAPVMVEAIKELKDELEELKREVETLKSENAELKKNMIAKNGTSVDSVQIDQALVPNQGF